MNFDERKPLLEHVRELKTDAEDQQKDKVFLPVPAHRRALRPEIVVIQGGRGTGKSALFHLTTSLGPKLRDFFNDPSLPSAQWIDAFSQVMKHPTGATLDALAKTSQGDEPFRAFWLGHLLGRLSDEGVEGAQLPAEFAQRRKGHETDPQAWVPWIEANTGTAASSLDSVERALGGRERFVFASYDYLDRLGDLDVTLRRQYVRALLSLWLSLSSRYRWLRAKVFLRHDLFETAQQDFPDASKLRSRSQSLDWDVDTLFALVARHLANSGPVPIKMRAWLKERAGIEFAKHGEFGWIPEDFDADARQRFVAAMAGEVMGEGVKKGYTWRWIPDRLQDADGRIVPRSLLRLFAFSAEHALRDPLKSGKQLVKPTDLVAAVAETSRQRVRELLEEYEVVKRLKNLEGVTLLLERREAEKLLAKPVNADDKLRLSGSDVLDELARIGVISIRPDRRIDVPDIYRSGYGIKRKGGARRPT